MKTDDLIDSLTADLPATPVPTVEARALRWLALGAVATALIFALFLGFRPALPDALSHPVTAAKTLLPLALAIPALICCLRQAHPGAAPSRARYALWLPPALAAALAVGAYIVTRPGLRFDLFIGSSIDICGRAIVALSVPMLAGLLIALRRGGPVHPTRCGALAGLAAGAFAATIYSLFCTEDSPLFYAVWYSLAIGAVAGLGALLGRMQLRW